MDIPDVVTAYTCAGCGVFWEAQSCRACSNEVLIPGYWPKWKCLNCNTQNRSLASARKTNVNVAKTQIGLSVIQAIFALAALGFLLFGLQQLTK
jgi:hypothetical protein